MCIGTYIIEGCSSGQYTVTECFWSLTGQSVDFLDMDLEKIIALGEKLGYEGGQLQKFVKDTQEEREKERQEREREREERDRESERRYKLLELEKQAEIKVIEMEAASRLSNENPTNPSVKQQGLAPKLPYFDETKDNMDSYLTRFECFAKAQNWDNSDYATYLSALLRGKSLDVYTRLSPENARNYNELKKALLKHYLLTEEGFKDKFESSEMEKGETAVQFAARLTKYFDRWIDLSETGKTYHELGYQGKISCFATNRSACVFERDCHWKIVLKVPIDILMHITLNQEYQVQEANKNNFLGREPERLKKGKVSKSLLALSVTG